MTSCKIPSNRTSAFLDLLTHLNCLTAFSTVRSVPAWLFYLIQNTSNVSYICGWWLRCIPVPSSFWGSLTAFSGCARSDTQSPSKCLHCDSGDLATSQAAFSASPLTWGNRVFNPKEFIAIAMLFPPAMQIWIRSQVSGGDSASLHPEKNALTFTRAFMILKSKIIVFTMKITLDFVQN